MEFIILDEDNEYTIKLNEPMMMRRIFLTAFIAMGTFLIASSQSDSTNYAAKNDGEIRTLFKGLDKSVKVGFYGSPDFSWTQFDNRNVYMMGLSGGVILNHTFSIGLAGKGIVNSHDLWYNNIQDSVGAYLYGGYGGLKLEYKLFPESPVHLSFPLLIGAGGLVYSNFTYQDFEENDEDFEHSDYNIDSDGFFVIEPGVMLEINLIKFMRLNAGVSYRYASQINLMNTSNGLLNNFNVNVALVFGKF